MSCVQLKGLKALVTGGTSGIGRAIARLYAKEGADVAILGTHAGRAQEVIQELESLRVIPEQKFVSFLVDVASTTEVEAILTQLLAQFGGIDILVNNAGITRDGLLMRMSEEDWDRVLDVNLKSLYNCCRVLVRPMMKARRGVILNMTSVIGLTGNVGQVNYAASKSGVIGFTKSLARELASRGIRVNCIAPGYIETSMTEGLPEALKQELLATIPLGRMGSAEEVAEAALFFVSPRAKYITGQVLAVDGGMVMH